VLQRVWRRAIRCAIVAGITVSSGCGSNAPTNRALDPANELPFGRIDVPAAGAQVAASVTVGGWALDDRGIAEVRIYVDNHFAALAPLNTDRADVSKAFAPYAKGNDKHGWTVAIAFDAPGPHTIVAQAVDSDGATRDIGTIAVTSSDK
jgi:hypothetical protein